MPRGLLVAVVGPSGAGKDTLLRQAALALAHRTDIVFVRRAITRTSHDPSEDYDALTPQAFAAARQAGAFCLTWQAHGLDYAIPRSASEQVAQGNMIVANLSRTVIHQAAGLFASMAIVDISADPVVLAQRIGARGREGKEDAAKRVMRRVDYTAPTQCRTYQIDNSHCLALSTEKFVSLLSSLKQ